MRILLKFASLILVPVILCVNPTQGAQEPFSIVITPAQAIVKAGSEVRVDILLTNMSGDDIMVAAMGRPSYDMDVRDSNGKQTPETERMRKIHAPHEPGTGFSGSVVLPKLPPGKSMRDYLSVSEFYDLSIPGKYTIQLQGTDLLTKKSVKSNTISVTMTP